MQPAGLLAEDLGRDLERGDAWFVGGVVRRPIHPTAAPPTATAPHRWRRVVVRQCPPPARAAATVPTAVTFAVTIAVTGVCAQVEHGATVKYMKSVREISNACSRPSSRPTPPAPLPSSIV